MITDSELDELVARLDELPDLIGHVPQEARLLINRLTWATDRNARMTLETLRKLGS